ncbi:hypothetical protein IE077_001650 [Cardiosporidium cionae]|uniref:Uncharacterized protein n=1 Tax=Cardiosporidium cionae TaxID=476202 RepID=A0ABQ7J577_9APIC|nr:hypothetical protein IE077_001650 [Cardiosporidium cionae]|eukprot:KAF8819108.1 hypothetical protein IE077_001650 [Cardiosporidium cionae]
MNPTLNFDDCTVVVDETSSQLLKECIIDYSDDLMCSSFVVKQNKYAKESCGCGHSFDVDLSL